MDRARSALLVLVALLIGGFGSIACGNGEGDAASGSMEAREVVAQALQAGPVTVSASAVGPMGEYRIEGDLDSDRTTYRLCGTLQARPKTVYAGPKIAYDEAPTVHISGKSGHYETVIKLDPISELMPEPAPAGCKRAGWFDDHPPTLPLFDYNRNLRNKLGDGAYVGAESYLQLALLALTSFEAGVTDVRSLGGGGYRAGFDFAAADVDPEERSEGRWQMEPLIRKVGTLQLELRATDGQLTSLSFEAPPMDEASSGRPVEVTVALSDPGSGEPVPRAEVVAIE